MNKRAKNIVAAIFFFAMFSSFAQQFILWKGDTINRIDSSGKKQGYWIKFGKDKPGTCYKEDQNIEEGIFIDNKKSGVWREYYCNGNKKHEVTFVKGRPIGRAITYYENGNTKEEGYWSRTRWTGEYKRYNNFGEIETVMYFDSTGKVISKKINEYTVETGEYFTRYLHGEPPVPIDGYCILKKNNLTMMVGYFEKGRFFTGVANVYDDRRELTRTMHYKGGKYIGDNMLYEQSFYEK